ncbi:hypothetical protein L1987_34425 [Smallanthus sonchifolius]|uniref:Uncharacterized protein n=1 Tax=Smallanthus sonchifolius TaxID=185202 RepID=A0ACB9HV75_9ASTR|nr:hypothetical protein L1987_34425 [Smallanthus sonchifolius]
MVVVGITGDVGLLSSRRPVFWLCSFGPVLWIRRSGPSAESVRSMVAVVYSMHCCLYSMHMLFDGYLSLSQLAIGKGLMEAVVIDVGSKLLKAGFAILDQATSMIHRCLILHHIRLIFIY